ncbi:DUF4432 family protein [Paenibacillus thalictri]|uniref:DUF4432 family protein n=1 Tax=Paenibacillus thalictri TaxID=2527873 RepID=A0A4Q9DEZ7_9BACL|nr:DUF4432 family protein [Paenibacillus thalictri]TBL68479.1 DUF4432 family protein [Paenibacillus thalictri]
MNLFGHSYTRQELEARIGSMDQLCGFKKLQCTEGLENGTQAIHMWNAAGLQLWVLPDRGMDIGRVHFKGIPLTWSSRTGYVQPAYLQQEGWSKGFHGGLLATCGLNNVGPLCRDGDTFHEQHGSISRTPASAVVCQGVWQDDDYVMTVSGKVHDADSKGRHLQMQRSIRLEGDGLTVSIVDEATNLGLQSEPCMIQYHMNFGFPLIGPDASLSVAGVRRVLDRGRQEEIERARWGSFPLHLKQPEVLYYGCEYTEANEWGGAVVANPGLGLEASIEYTHKTLPHLWRWNQFTDGLHVCAIEPSNCLVKPRTSAKAEGRLPVLEPGQTERYGIRFSIKETSIGGNMP